MSSLHSSDPVRGTEALFAFSNVNSLRTLKDGSENTFLPNQFPVIKRICIRHSLPFKYLVVFEDCAPIQDFNLFLV